MSVVYLKITESVKRLEKGLETLNIPDINSPALLRGTMVYVLPHIITERTVPPIVPLIKPAKLRQLHSQHLRQLHEHHHVRQALT